MNPEGRNPEEPPRRQPYQDLDSPIPEGVIPNVRKIQQSIEECRKSSGKTVSEFAEIFGADDESYLSLIWELGGWETLDEEKQFLFRRMYNFVKAREIQEQQNREMNAGDIGGPPNVEMESSESLNIVQNPFPTMEFDASGAMDSVTYQQYLEREQFLEYYNVPTSSESRNRPETATSSNRDSSIYNQEYMDEDDFSITGPASKILEASDSDSEEDSKNPLCAPIPEKANPNFETILTDIEKWRQNSQWTAQEIFQKLLGRRGEKTTWTGRNIQGKKLFLKIYNFWKMSDAKRQEILSGISIHKILKILTTPWPKHVIPDVQSIVEAVEKWRNENQVSMRRFARKVLGKSHEKYHDLIKDPVEWKFYKEPETGMLLTLFNFLRIPEEKMMRVLGLYLYEEDPSEESFDIGNLPYPDTTEPRIDDQMELFDDFSMPYGHFEQNVNNANFEVSGVYHSPVHLQPAPMRNAFPQPEPSINMLQFLHNQHALLQPEPQPVVPANLVINNPAQALRILDRRLVSQTLNTVQLLKDLNTWHKDYKTRHPWVTQKRFSRKILNRKNKFFSKIPTEYDNMREKRRRVYTRVYHWLNSIGEQQRDQILDMDLTVEPGFYI